MKFIKLLAAIFPMLFALGAAQAATNLLQTADDFTSSPWTTFSMQATTTANASTSPDKTQDATHLVVGGYIGQVLSSAIPGHTYVFSTWMKSATGAEQDIALCGENNPPAADTKQVAFSVTSSWQRFYIVFKCPDAGNSNFRFSYRAGDMFVWHPVVEDVTGSSSQRPSDVPGAPATAIGTAAAKPAPAAPAMPAAPDKPASKNLLKASDDFGSTEWTSFSLKTTITPKAALSPDKTQDAAHLVIGAFVGQILPTAIPGHTYVFSTWMKSATGADRIAGWRKPAPRPGCEVRTV
jgi:hypothetical protein